MIFKKMKKKQGQTDIKEGFFYAMASKLVSFMLLDKCLLDINTRLMSKEFFGCVMCV